MSERTCRVALSVAFFTAATYIFWCGVVLAVFWRPEPSTVTFAVPTGVALYRGEQVTPGTFKITLPLNEWLERFKRNEHPEQPIATFSALSDRSCYGSSAKVTYWLPRRDGTFFQAQETVPISWSTPWFVFGLGRDNYCVGSYELAEREPGLWTVKLYPTVQRMVYWAGPLLTLVVLVIGMAVWPFRK